MFFLCSLSSLLITVRTFRSSDVYSYLWNFLFLESFHRFVFSPTTFYDAFPHFLWKSHATHSMNKYCPLPSVLSKLYFQQLLLCHSNTILTVPSTPIHPDSPTGTMKVRGKKLGQMFCYYCTGNWTAGVVMSPKLTTLIPSVVNCQPAWLVCLPCHAILWVKWPNPHVTSLVCHMDCWQSVAVSTAVYRSCPVWKTTVTTPHTTLDHTCWVDICPMAICLYHMFIPAASTRLTLGQLTAGHIN